LKAVFVKFSYLALMRTISILIGAISLGMTNQLVAQETEHQPGIYQFVENGGQWPAQVLYKADLAGGNIWLEKGGVLYQFLDLSGVERIHHDHSDDPKDTLIRQHLLYAEFVDASENCATTHKYPSSNYYNFFIGNESKWASGLHGYNHITYQELYPGINLLFLEKDQELKYEFQVAPHADPSQIKIDYHGEDKIKLTNDGSLVIETSLGNLTEQKPYAYQIKNGKIIEVPCEFVLSGKEIISYQIGNYDKSLELIIDPVLIFATYSGSTTDNFGMTATYAYDGKAYSGGTIYGNAYPTPAPAYDDVSNFTGVSSASYGITDVFISKYSEDGSTMLWTSFLGGGDNTQGTETVHSLICDKDNNIYLYGATSSIDFPTQNAFQSAHAGGTPNSNYFYNGVYYTFQGTDIYVSKLSSNGMTLMGSTYVGGSANDGINYRIAGGIYNSVASYDSLTSNYGDQFRGEIMLDSFNNVLIASSTRSSNFPVLNSFQPALGGQQDGIVFKLAADFSSLIWSTYFGGSANDACYSVKLDSSYNVLVAGGTSSTNIPGAAGGLNPAYMGGKTDGFVFKMTPDGSALTQSTYIGTAAYDQTIFVEIDRWDNVYIVGVTNGVMPVTSGVYSNPGSGQYIQKLNPALNAIDYATVFGNGSGIPNISPSAFLVDVCGNVYVSGWGANILQPTPLSGMPVTSDAFQLTPANGFDFYLFVLERDAASLLYGSYLGGASAQEHVDGGTSRFDKYGIIYQSVCGGCGGFSDFPTTTGAWSANNLSTNCNNILFKFDFEIVPIADFQISQLVGCAPLILDLDNESNDTLNSVWSFPTEAIVLSGGASPTIMFEEPGTYNIYLSITDTICNLTDTAVKVVTVYEALELEIPGDTIICAASTFDLVANSFGTATGFTWDDTPDFSSPLATGMDSTISVSPGTEATFYITATNGWPLCDIVDSVQVFFVDGAVEVMDDTTICFGSNVFLHATNLVPSVNMTFDWSPNGSLISESGNIAIGSPASTMYYYVTATTDLGCVFTDSVLVTVINFGSSIYATATPDTIPEGGSSVLEAFPTGYSYVWNPPLFLSNPTSQTTTATVNETSTYEVTITAGSCSTKTSVTIYTREFICGDVYIYVPNAFSPNADNVNDVLFVRGENLMEINLKIFDRWGELVFETQDQSVGWDGTFKGEKLDPDVYVYHLTVKCVDQTENLIKGNITLMR
jgi:gliding motility-associated-like protein